MNFKKLQVALTVVLCAVIVMMASGRSFSGKEAVTMQDPASLDRRISLLEQRFYLMETSINRLQQSVLIQQRAPSPVQNDRSQELNLAREEIERLRLRMSEVECGLLKLDERTTAVRDRKVGDAKAVDPCRTNPTTPVRLSTRP